jgi:hypothetical protein
MRMATTPDAPQPDWIEPQSPPEIPGDPEPIGEPGDWPDEINPGAPDEIDPPALRAS